MNKKFRKEALEKLNKKASLEKRANDAVDDVNLANIEDPQEYANKVFEALLENLKNNIKIDGLDD